MTEDQRDFVPDDFEVPTALAGDGFRLEPLEGRHNEADLAAWSGSIAHVRATPGFVGRSWPPLEGMSAEANLADLEGHARDFAERRGFTYSVVEGEGEVIGCLYVYPSKEDAGRVHVSSWVRQDRAHLDTEVHAAVTRWFAEVWPFDAGRIDYAPR
ncbi:N-acetyltransferase [Streptomyces sp. NBC_00249]|uniref:N-acetyltransferase n=1 Tax=Streptomyces sp. NBC_00249 TaxID=2975690 RepID=UPI00224CA041|nr:N-acetyltransferase [Streptomyces sp. NBC_00249]MCX5198683.1 N-acetyltransferase [Streptomyces sp. NBC_00249]